MDNKDKNKKARAHDGQPKVNKRESLAEGVPMLVFGGDTNLKEVERCLQLVVVMKYEKRLNFFAKMKYPKIKSPSYDQERYLKKDEPGYRIIVDKTLGKFAEQELEAEANKPKLHAMIMEVLSAGWGSCGQEARQFYEHG